MYTAIIRHEFKHKYVYIGLAFVLVLTFLWVKMFNVNAIPASSEVFAYWEVFAFFYALFLITFYSNKYSDYSFRKISSIHDFNKVKLNVNLFILISIMITIFTISYFIIFYSMYNIGFLSDSGTANLNDNNNPLVPFFSINLWFFTYSIAIEILLMMSITFLFNAIFRGSYFQYGLIVVYILAASIYNPTIWNILYLNQDQVFLVNYEHNLDDVFIQVNLFIMPWTQVGLRATEMFTNDGIILPFSGYYDTSSFSGIYHSLSYLPYITILSYFGLSVWIEEWKIKRNFNY